MTEDGIFIVKMLDNGAVVSELVRPSQEWIRKRAIETALKKKTPVSELAQLRAELKTKGVL